MIDDKIVTMGIESSCDETSVAIVADGREVLSNVILSQIDIHKIYGGVVPEIASRQHLESINGVVEQALKNAGCTMEEIDVLGVTQGPGLVGALLIGIATAKSYALATGKPLVGVHHIHGHVCANYIEHKELKPPLLALVVSGGHTNLIYVKSYMEYEILGQTRDDAVGEAYDKVARVLGLGYPGGPKIDKVAQMGNEDAVYFKRVFLEKGSKDFSFSGIKTGVLNYINGKRQRGEEINVPDVAASFQRAVLDVLVKKAVDATVELKQDKLVLAGGVAANSKLKKMLEEKCANHEIELFYPSVELSTDNGAMIACAAYYKYRSGQMDDLNLDADVNLKI